MVTITITSGFHSDLFLSWALESVRRMTAGLASPDLKYLRTSLTLIYFPGYTPCARYASFLSLRAAWLG